MTEREGLALSELKLELAAEYGWRCPFCGAPLLSGQLQLAHRIAQTKANIAHYGVEIIHHRLNLVPVDSLRCNALANIGFRPVEAERLAQEIKESIEKEAMAK